MKQFYKKWRPYYLWIIFLFAVSCFVAQGEGFTFRHVFQRGKIKCISRYTIYRQLPIKIKRTYQDGRTEYIILKPTNMEDASQLYELIKNSISHIQPFLPSTVKSYGKDIKSTRSALERLQLEALMSFRVNLGIYYKKNRTAEERLIGLIGVHSHNCYKKDSYDAFYMVGNPDYVGVKGVATIALSAFYNFLIATRPISCLNIVTLPHNHKSASVAKKMGGKRVSTDKYKRWGYAEKKNEVIVFHIPTRKWQKKYWKKYL